MKPFEVLRQIAIALAGESVEDLNGNESTIASRLIEAGMLKIEDNTLHLTTFAVAATDDGDVMPIPCAAPTTPGSYLRKDTAGYWHNCTVRIHDGVIGYWNGATFLPVADDTHTVEWRK